MAQRALLAAVGTAIVLILADGRARAQEPPARAADPPPTPTPTPTPSPTPRPSRRLKLDLDRRIDDIVKRRDRSDLPRFEDRIDVEDRTQEALDEMLRGLDLACAPSDGGPPPTSELNDFREAKIPPYADFFAAAKAIFKGLRKKGPADWYLYGVTQGDSLRFVVRKGELPVQMRLAQPGTVWEEISRFDSAGEATAAMRRLERGFETLKRRTPGDPAHPSMRINCLPQEQPERR
jgi:hypothetical protein